MRPTIAPKPAMHTARWVSQFSYVNPDYAARVPGSVVLEAAKVIAERKQYLKPRA